MPDLSIPWYPRVLMTDRIFRLPVQADDDAIDLETGAFQPIASRWSPRDFARYYYIRTPDESGDYTVTARRKGQSVHAVIQVRTLDDLRRIHEYNGATWPRRWQLGQAYHSMKQQQTLQDLPPRREVDAEQLVWWTSQTDETLWRQLPPAELPQAHFVNVHQGCPNCGTAVFRFNGFYPWMRSHLPCDFRSICPSCGAQYPSNNIGGNDFISGDTPDDGFGYFDNEGHLYLFTATYHRDQVVRFDTGIQLLTARLRSGAFDESIARQLAMLLLRYAADILYVAAVPQFRYGPSRGEEEPWTWGQPDWASETDPVATLATRGMRRYSIDVPYVSESLALAYDTIWPFIRDDKETVSRAQAFGLTVQYPDDVVALIEEMLAAQLQCILDRGARSNLPRESMGALSLLRGLDRPDAQDVMDWLYDTGPDRLRVFGINDFFPDGSPSEATGGYNSIHTNGLFALEYHLRHLRTRHPAAYPESRYPSLVSDPRAARVARQPHEIMMIGKSWFQFGDGSAPGCKDQFGPESREDTLVMDKDIFHPQLDPQMLKRAAEFTGNSVVREIREAVEEDRHRALGTTIHDGVGIAILRTAETPERAALGIVYGDATNHRHMDLLDVQLLAYQRLFLTDLGYPQSWATAAKWEGNWATHNTAWGVVPDTPPDRIAGRGRLRRTLFTDGLQILDIEAERWAWDEALLRWYRPGVTFRRLLALVETDGQGVALVDLSRTCGGTEHWRVCRGLQGTFDTDDLSFTPRPGTVVDENGVRGDTDRLTHADYDGLACMDDVATTDAVSSWTGFWRSTREPAVHLDLYQLNASPSTGIMTARATALMGTPEESSYAYRALLWRRHPTDTQDVTCIDLVMEPRVGEATLSDARALTVADGSSTATGVVLHTRSGKTITIYWAPDSNSETVTAFSDGATLHGPLAATVGESVFLAGATAFDRQGRIRRGTGPQDGRIAAIDRHACTIDIEGIAGIEPGDRIRINPDGRGHNYAVETVETLEASCLRLTLDVSSLLGRAPVVGRNRDRIELGMNIIARTGNLDQTRLIVESDETRATIISAFNPEPGFTTVWVDDVTRVASLSDGDWVQVVDYVVGDRVVFEPMEAFR